VKLSMSIFNSAYEALVWGSFYLIEFIANLVVIAIGCHKMGWIGGNRNRTEAEQPPVSNVQQASSLVSGVSELLKTAKGAWTEVAPAPTQPPQPSGHQPIYQQQQRK
jgi:hypothetical protein